MPFFATRETVFPPNMKEGADSSFFSDGNTLTTSSDGSKKQRGMIFLFHLQLRSEVCSTKLTCQI